MVYLLEVFEAIKRRRSIRKYEEKAVENESLSKILEGARLTPSAMNRQSNAFVVTREKETIKNLILAVISNGLLP
jgi:nitroreductase